MGKIELMARSLQWVKSGTGSAKGGSFSWGKTAYRAWDILQDTSGCDDTFATEGTGGTFDDPGSNMVAVNYNKGGKTRATENSVTVRFNLTNAFGAPDVLSRLPDGTVILEAQAEITGTGVTRTYMVNGVPTVSTTPAEYRIVGLTGPTTWETVGSVTASIDGQETADVTDVIQAMFDHRADGLYPYGYGALIVPSDLGVGDLTAMIPGQPPVGTEADGSACGYHSFFDADSIEDTITWGGISIGTILIKVQYPESEYQRQILMPRLPAMAD